MATGDLIKLGTLYLGGTRQARPTRPWRPDSTPSGGPGNGNIPTFSAGQSIEIRDTDAAESNQIYWREINEGGKKYLVADRCILTSASWDDLNAQDLIFGKEITVDGQQYKVRSLTGGVEKREGGTGGSYAGGKLPNEWDRWIVNEGNLPGLPKPNATDLDSSMVESDRVGNHNQFWNWYFAYSWCQDTYLHSGSIRAIRGYHSARYYLYNTQSNRHAIYAFRPVLEVLNSAPQISGDAQNQGNKTGPFTINYSVLDPEGDAVNVVEKLNGTTLKMESNIEQGVNHTIEITPEMWGDIPLNTISTIKVEATDSKGAKSVREYTFTKSNAEPTSTIVEPRGDSVDIAILDTLTPVLVHKFEDIDPNDSQSAYQYIIENLNGELIHDTGKVLTTQSFFQVPQGKLSWGTRAKFKVRVWDRYDIPSKYSGYQFFMPNRPPNVSDVQPGSDDSENPAGAGTAPEFTWNFEDLDSESQTAYQVQIFDKDNNKVLDTSKVFKNSTYHKVADGILQEGNVYAVTVTVWDPNGLSETSEKAYFRTNATPSAPYSTGPVDNYRTSPTPAFEAIVGTDPEDDGQHFMIEISKDSKFEKDVLKFRSDENRVGWKVGGFDIPEGGVFNSSQGQTVRYESQVDLDKNNTYFWRMSAIDAKTKAVGSPSSARKIRVGNELKFTIASPIITGAVASRRILLAAEYSIASDGTNKAQMIVEVSNNALDASPTWEDATEQFLAMEYFNFTNLEKTAEEFAVGARITIKANDSLGAITMDALGLTFD